MVINIILLWNMSVLQDLSFNEIKKNRKCIWIKCNKHMMENAHQGLCTALAEPSLYYHLRCRPVHTPYKYLSFWKSNEIINQKFVFDAFLIYCVIVKYDAKAVGAVDVDVVYALLLHALLTDLTVVTPTVLSYWRTRCTIACAFNKVVQMVRLELQGNTAMLSTQLNKI